jgi:hypothetical protein
MNERSADMLLLGLALLAVAFLFWRFFWKRKGTCHECSSTSCLMAQRRQ